MASLLVPVIALIAGVAACFPPSTYTEARGHSAFDGARINRYDIRLLIDPASVDSLLFQSMQIYAPYGWTDGRDVALGRLAVAGDEEAAEWRSLPIFTSLEKPQCPAAHACIVDYVLQLRLADPGLGSVNTSWRVQVHFAYVDGVDPKPDWLRLTVTDHHPTPSTAQLAAYGCGIGVLLGLAALRVVVRRRRDVSDALRTINLVAVAALVTAAAAVVARQWLVGAAVLFLLAALVVATMTLRRRPSDVPSANLLMLALLLVPAVMWAFGLSPIHTAAEVLLGFVGPGLLVLSGAARFAWPVSWWTERLTASQPRAGRLLLVTSLLILVLLLIGLGGAAIAPPPYGAAAIPVMAAVAWFLVAFRDWVSGDRDLMWAGAILVVLFSLGGLAILLLVDVSIRDPGFELPAEMIVFPICLAVLAALIAGAAAKPPRAPRANS